MTITRVFFFLFPLLELWEGGQQGAGQHDTDGHEEDEAVG